MGYGIVNTGFPVRSEAFDPAGSAAAVQANLAAHMADKNNPHGLDADDVGARPSTWVPAWGDVTGKPSTFQPSGHTHDASQIASGILSAARGGTGVGSIADLAALLTNQGLGGAVTRLARIQPGQSAVDVIDVNIGDLLQYSELWVQANVPEAPSTQRTSANFVSDNVNRYAIFSSSEKVFGFRIKLLYNNYNVLPEVLDGDGSSPGEWLDRAYATNITLRFYASGSGDRNFRNSDILVYGVKR